MSVKIGHAIYDENESKTGGTAGDQTSREVCIWEWYNKPWTEVFRPKDSAVAQKIALAMEQAVANEKIGYDQGQRTTLYTKAKAVDWDLSKITEGCECDCSSLVAVCVNAAGITVNKNMYTGNEKAALTATEAFTVLTEAAYIGSDVNLMRGDILLGKGHTAVVLSNGSLVNQSYSLTLRKLKKGCTGEDVRALQILLSGRGYNGNMHTPDGKFGANTEGAVKLYQKAKGLTVDGIVGQKTMASLLGVDAS